MLSISLPLERKYGAWRIAVLWCVASVGGQLTSAVWEDWCKVVVGASGGVFGVMGLFVVDMVVNFKTIKRPILQCLLIVVVLIFFIVEMKQVMPFSRISDRKAQACLVYPCHPSVSAQFHRQHLTVRSLRSSTVASAPAGPLVCVVCGFKRQPAIQALAVTLA